MLIWTQSFINVNVPLTLRPEKVSLFQRSFMAPAEPDKTATDSQATRHQKAAGGVNPPEGSTHSLVRFS
jgi:hypothetical protein